MLALGNVLITIAIYAIPERLAFLIVENGRSKLQYWQAQKIGLQDQSTVARSSVASRTRTSVRDTFQAPTPNR
jgi:hypothetical protein